MHLGDVSKGRIVDFTVAGNSLANCILEQMKNRINEAFPDNKPVSEEDTFDADALEQQIFAQKYSMDFVGRHMEIREVMSYLRGDGGRALFIIGNNGIGKTALLSRICRGISEAGGRFLYRFCGVTEKSGSERDLYLSIGNESGLFRGSERDDSDAEFRIDNTFFLKLMDAGYNILILDAIDKIEESLHIDEIPEDFHLVISSDSLWISETFEFGFEYYEIKPLESDSDKAAVMEAFLKRSLKKLDREQTAIITGARGSVYPLYLRIVLNELKRYGSFARLEDKIRSFGENPADAFKELLHHLEQARDVDGILSAVDDDDIFMNIYPPEYRSEYLNGYHFGRVEAPFGNLFWLDDEGCTYLRRFGLALLLRAKNEIDALNSEFPHPYEPKCRALKESGDEEGFFRFRDRIYHCISFAGAGLFYYWRGMPNGVTDENRKMLFEKLVHEYGGVFSFMDYLSKFGGDQTGLSYQIEDMAEAVRDQYDTYYRRAS